MKQHSANTAPSFAMVMSALAQKDVTPRPECVQRQSSLLDRI
jgi:hypothetical protein